jgi:hypothetical protein
MDITDREFRAVVMVLNSKDIRAVDMNPEPLVDRIQRRMLEESSERISTKG